MSNRTRGLLAILAAILLFGRAGQARAQEPSFAFLWGSFGTGDGEFNRPVDVTRSPDGFVYVCDALNHRIQKFTSYGVFVSKWGFFGTGPGQFKVPYQMAFDSMGHCYVADQGNHRIQKFDGVGGYLGQWGSQGTGAGQFEGPWGVAVDSADQVYVTEEVGHRVQKFTSAGTYLTGWGSFGTGDGQFDRPRGIDAGLDGTIYICEAQGNRVQRFTPAGALLLKWGRTGSPKGQSAPSPPGTFTHAYGLDVDVSGFVYVADWDLHPHSGRVQQFTPDSLFVAEWRGSGSAPGGFIEIYDVDAASNGLIYTADKLNHRIQVFTAGATHAPAPDPLPEAPWGKIKEAYRTTGR